MDPKTEQAIARLPELVKPEARTIDNQSRNSY